MINIKYCVTIFEIDKKFIDDNTYFGDILKEYMEKDGIINMKKIKYVEEYLKFMSIKNFEITLGFFKILDYDRGWKNSFNYPLEFFKIKIKEDH